MGFAFYITSITSIVLIAMMVYIVKSKNKGALHYSYLAIVLTVFVWTVAVMFQDLLKGDADYFILFENATYVGAAFAPVGLVFLATAYAQPDTGVTKKHFALCIIPFITQIMAWTNQYHHLFFIQYGIGDEPFIFGAYFYIHAIYSFVCLLYGFTYLSIASIKNSGITSIQALLILFGGLVPTAVNILYTIGVPGLDVFSTPIAFTFTLTMYLLAMFRFNLLKVRPIALQTVINRISDSFVVVGNSLNIIDYNASFIEKFQYIPGLHKGDNLNRILYKWNCVNVNPDEFRELIKTTVESHKTIEKDIEIDYNGSHQYYTVEFTPIIQNRSCAAIILLFKDITQHVNDMEKIRDNQAILLERERLASLGQLIGGIAHNLRTPIMSVAGGIDHLMYLTDEYDSSIGDAQVTDDDHHEIAAEMQQWLGKMKTHLSYMSDIISTVKEQATQINPLDASWFTLEEMLKRVKILMQHELIKNNCSCTQDIRVTEKLRIDGDINRLVQILDNIIVNAIHAYGTKGGEIVLKVEKLKNTLVITVCDYGAGIDEGIRSRLFKEMVTTKGKHGTGLGLYMSYSTIKAVFRGNMWFESSAQTGTQFHIQIPLSEGLPSGGN